MWHNSQQKKTSIRILSPFALPYLLINPWTILPTINGQLGCVWWIISTARWSDWGQVESGYYFSWKPGSQPFHYPSYIKAQARATRGGGVGEGGREGGGGGNALVWSRNFWEVPIVVGRKARRGGGLFEVSLVMAQADGFGCGLQMLREGRANSPAVAPAHDTWQKKGMARNPTACPLTLWV